MATTLVPDKDYYRSKLMVLTESMGLQLNDKQLAQIIESVLQSMKDQYDDWICTR